MPEHQKHPRQLSITITTQSIKAVPVRIINISHSSVVLCPRTIFCWLARMSLRSDVIRRNLQLIFTLERIVLCLESIWSYITMVTTSIWCVRVKMAFSLTISSFAKATSLRDYPARKLTSTALFDSQIHFKFSLFRCTLRFPSTNIRIQFENLVDQNNRKHDGPGGKSTSVENTNTVYRPLKISIPEQEGALKNIKSPFPSPTGTMSAANSCPTSPRHNNYHDFYSQSNNGHGSHNYSDMVS